MCICTYGVNYEDMYIIKGVHTDRPSLGTTDLGEL